MSLMGSKRRSRAAPLLRDGDAQLAGFVRQVPLDSGAGEDQHADRQHNEHRVVALEGRAAAVIAPVGAEGQLRHLALIGPAGGNQFGLLGRSALKPKTSLPAMHRKNTT